MAAKKTKNELAGNPSNRKKTTIPATKKAPYCPKTLSKEARAEWKTIVKELEEVGTLAYCDRASLIIYCEAWERYHSAKNAPLTMLTPNGVMAVTPEYQIVKNEREVMRRFLDQFGLTPSGRQKLGIEIKDGDDDFTRFVMGEGL